MTNCVNRSLSIVLYLVGLKWYLHFKYLLLYPSNISINLLLDCLWKFNFQLLGGYYVLDQNNDQLICLLSFVYVVFRVGSYRYKGLIFSCPFTYIYTVIIPRIQICVVKAGFDLGESWNFPRDGINTPEDSSFLSKVLVGYTSLRYLNISKLSNLLLLKLDFRLISLTLLTDGAIILLSFKGDCCENPTYRQ